MNETLKEQISAYVDGELPDGESELLVRRLSQDPSLRDLADSYLAIGRAIRGEVSMPRVAGLRERIAQNLGSETPQPAEAAPAQASNRYLRPIAGVGIAAAVAVLALLGLQQVGPEGGLPEATTAANDLAAIAIDEAPLYTEPPVVEFVSDRPSATLTRYYQQHNERAADIGGSGIFSRLVELELRGGELLPAVETLNSTEAVAAEPPAADVEDAGSANAGEQ